MTLFQLTKTNLHRSLYSCAPQRCSLCSPSSPPAHRSPRRRRPNQRQSFPRQRRPYPQPGLPPRIRGARARPGKIPSRVPARDAQRKELYCRNVTTSAAASRRRPASPAAAEEIRRTETAMDGLAGTQVRQRSSGNWKRATHGPPETCDVAGPMADLAASRGYARSREASPPRASPLNEAEEPGAGARRPSVPRSASAERLPAVRSASDIVAVTAGTPSRCALRANSSKRSQRGPTTMDDRTRERLRRGGLGG